MNEKRTDLTQVLIDMSGGHSSPERVEVLTAGIYHELRQKAERLLHRERPDHSLEPSALVHEAYIRLIDQDRIGWKDRAHFLGFAVRAMRQVLVDHARRHRSQKRGGGQTRVSLHSNIPDLRFTPELEVLSLDRALRRLSCEDERVSRVAELRVLGGLTMEEIATVVGASKRTVENDWSVARLWLTREMRPTN